MNSFGHREIRAYAFCKSHILKQKQCRKRGDMMGKLQYIVQEIFVSADAGERERRLQSLMDAYIRTLEKQIAQNESFG